MSGFAYDICERCAGVQRGVRDFNSESPMETFNTSTLWSRRKHGSLLRMENSIRESAEKKQQNYAAAQKNLKAKAFWLQICKNSFIALDNC
jgi:hypothetical protein